MQRKIKKEKHKHQKAVASFWSYIWSEEEQDWKFIYLFSEILKKKKIGSLCVYIYREREIYYWVSLGWSHESLNLNSEQQQSMVLINMESKWRGINWWYCLTPKTQTPKRGERPTRRAQLQSWIKNWEKAKQNTTFSTSICFPKSKAFVVLV